MNDVYGRVAQAAGVWRFFEPVFRDDLVDDLVGVAGDLGQRVFEVVEGIDAQAAAGLDDGEEDGAALAAFGVAFCNASSM